MVAVGVAPVTVTDARPVALIVGVLTLTVSGLPGQPCGEGEPLEDGVPLGDAPATTLRQPVHVAVFVSVSVTTTSRAPPAAALSATSVARRFSGLTNSTDVTVMPSPA